MKRIYYFLAIACTVLSYSCNSNAGSTSTQSNDSNQVDKKDTAAQNAQPVATIQNNFATKAAIGGMMEVESSARMIRSTENRDIQNLAIIMVKDHSAANRTLIALAKKLQIKLPDTLPTEKSEILKQMKPLKEFEKNLFYADLMVKEHNEAVALFENAAANETGELQAFAKKTLPTLKVHRTHALSVQKVIHSIQGDMGDRPLKTSKDRQ